MSTRVLVCAGLLASGLLFGCNRTIQSPEYPFVNGDQPPTPTNVTAQLNDRAVHLTWQMSSTTGVSKYRVFVYDDQGQTLMAKDSSLSLSKTIQNLPPNKEYQFQVSAVSATGVESSRSTSISATVALMSIIMNNNDRFTNSREVSVQFNVPRGATHVLISEDSTFADAQSLPFSQSKLFTLSSGDAVKRVYSRVIFDNGNETGTPLSDQITLDTRAAIQGLTFSAPTNQFFEVNDTIVFSMVAGESDGLAAVSFASVNAFPLYDDGSLPGETANDGIYTGRYIVLTEIAVDNGVVTGSFRDEAGNVALNVTAPNPISIHTAPQPVQITGATPEATFKASLGWTQNASSAFMWYRIFRATAPDVSTSSELIATISNKATVSYTDTTLSPDTKYFYRIYVGNSIGVSSPSNVDSVQTPVNTAPGTITIAGAYTDSTKIRINWTRSDDDDFSSYRIYRATGGTVDSLDQQVAIINTRNNDSFTDFVGATASMRYRMYVFDRHGLASASNEIGVNR